MTAVHKETRGGYRGKSRPINEIRAKQIKKLWDPSRDIRDKCLAGHKFTEESTYWQITRGRASRRCRICLNAYHKRYERDARWGKDIIKRLNAAERVLLRVIKSPRLVDPELVALAARFGEEARRRWRVAINRAPKRSK